MANKRTRALTVEEYDQIIDTMRTGFAGCRPNDRIATALIIEANLGIRISDILKLKLSDIIKEGSRYRLNIIEQKTKKNRNFTVPFEIFQYIKIYCLENGIKDNEIIFPITERAVQKQLKIVTDWLELDNISTHSFRKFLLHRFIRIMITTLFLCSSCCSIVLRQLHSGTSAYHPKTLKRH